MQTQISEESFQAHIAEQKIHRQRNNCGWCGDETSTYDVTLRDGQKRKACSRCYYSARRAGRISYAGVSLN